MVYMAGISICSTATMPIPITLMRDLLNGKQGSGISRECNWIWHIYDYKAFESSLNNDSALFGVWNVHSPHECREESTIKLQSYL